MARIVTSTYRYKPPPRRKGRKLAEITWEGGPSMPDQQRDEHIKALIEQHRPATTSGN